MLYYSSKISEKKAFQKPHYSIYQSSTILDQEIRRIISHSDRVIAKLDAASQKTFEKINLPHNSVPKIENIIEGLALFKKEYPNTQLIIQTLLIHSQVNNIGDDDIISLANAYCKIKPDLIHIYTIARLPACSNVLAVSLSNWNNKKSNIG
jgi:wyosine [tRNA(Phe)-imidazoG37] synthetase (radical SAM superfamily)